MSAPSSSLDTITYVVELTPVGRAAVAVLLVEGPDAVRQVDDCFVARSGRTVANTPFDRIVVGHWGGGGGEELIVCRRGEHRVEVHCHGGVAAIRAIIASLVAKGCRELAWREWCRRSSTDPIESEARIALADATTLRTAAILLDQLNGALTTAIRAAIAAVAAGGWPRAVELISELLANRELGLHLTTPWRVVLAGSPNVGKSSLINALAGYERAIVAPTPGTTRDVVTFTTAIEGWPVELADTAGLRTSEDELESAGIRLAQMMLAAADLVIFVHDATQPEVEIDSEFISSIRIARIVHVRNKVDLLPNAAVGARDDRHLPRSEAILYTSARTGQGISELTSAIAKSLVPSPPAAGAAVPFLAQQVEALIVARNAIERHHTSGAVEALQSLLAHGKEI